MTEIIICPDDGRECIYPERQEEGCWNCPKIQNVLEQIKAVSKDEISSD